MTTFTEDDWENLTSHDKQAIRAIGRVAPADFEPLRKFKGVGPTKISSLLAKGLVAQGEGFPRRELGYRLTDEGWLAFNRCIGRRAY